LAYRRAKYFNAVVLTCEIPFPNWGQGGGGIEFSDSYRWRSSGRRPTLSLTKIDLDSNVGGYFLSHIIIHSPGPIRGTDDVHIVQIRQQFLPRSEISIGTLKCIVQAQTKEGGHQGIPLFTSLSLMNVTGRIFVICPDIDAAFAVRRHDKRYKTMSGREMS